MPLRCEVGAIGTLRVEVPAGQWLAGPDGDALTNIDGADYVLPGAPLIMDKGSSFWDNVKTFNFPADSAGEPGHTC